MNRVFLVLVVVAVAAGLGQDVWGAFSEAPRAPDASVSPVMASITEGLLKYASIAAEIALGLIGILALWMGVLRVAEAAGLVQKLALLLRPIMVRLFPDVPADHPAMGAMIMNIAANMLGLGNAATPLGLEAMRRLQELNQNKRTATNAMCMFLAINTSGLTLIPTKVLALRAENGAQEPTSILLPTLLATACSTVVAITAAKLMQGRFAVFADEPPAEPEAGSDATDVTSPGEGPASEEKP